MRVLFLDIDGVLHPAGIAYRDAPDTELFCFVPVLSRLLAGHDDVVLVITSSWREVHTLDDLREMFEPLGGRVIAVVANGYRYDAICAWLRQNPALVSYRILDDDPSEFPTPTPQALVLCDSKLGLSERRVQSELQDWLEAPAV